MQTYKEIIPTYEEYLKIQIQDNDIEEDMYPKWVEGQYRYVQNAFASVDRTAKILDIACGSGVGLTCLKKMGFTDVVGVELRTQKVDKAVKIGFPVHTVDMHDLSIFPDNLFDIVYSSHTLEHAYEPSKVLFEFYRILKSQALLKVVLPYPDNGTLKVHGAKFELGTATLDDGHTIIAYFQTHGFELIDKHYDTFREPEIWLTFRKRSPSLTVKELRTLLLEASKSAIGLLVLELHKLASQYKHVTEFGVQKGPSTLSLAYGRSEQLVSYEFNDVLEPEMRARIQTAANWKYILADTRTIDIELTDFLFIDTKHTYEQLLTELRKHASKVRHVIAMHDVFSFGVFGEFDQKQGLLYAINEFLAECPEWYIERLITGDHGLCILKRK
jgi:SAM-dependent methyltransferase